MIIGYLRVSTGKQHPANQQDEIRRFAKNKNWTIDNWAIEVASSRKHENDRKLGLLLGTLFYFSIFAVVNQRLNRAQQTTVFRLSARKTVGK